MKLEVDALTFNLLSYILLNSIHIYNKITIMILFSGYNSEGGRERKRKITLEK